MDQKQAIADRLKQANNILVTVSNNPTVDQLSACIGLTLALNKLGKHATAVFSGAVPSTIEFLQPEKTLEKNTDSLRDFIIALDKSKADKLRYKVEDKVVKIFITPYRTSISEKDLEFSQGDFNVDVVIALGVHNQPDLDQAITSHGRILHDAVVATVNLKPGGEIGTINWLQQGASSLCELVVELIDVIDKGLLDTQMATALLTGIVAETNRFSNEKTSPSTMSVSAELMSAGANQQLVATKLDEPAPLPQVHDQAASGQSQPLVAAESVPRHDDGTLEITHDTPTPIPSEPAAAPPPPLPPLPDLPMEEEEKPEPLPQIHIDDNGGFMSKPDEDQLPPLPPLPSIPSMPGNTDPTVHLGSTRMILEPPKLAGAEFTASTEPEESPAGAPISLPQPSAPAAFAPPASAATAPPPALFVPPAPTPPPPAPVVPPAPAPAPPPPPAPAPLTPPTPATPPLPPGPTLTEIEQAAHSPHIAPPPAPAPPPPTAVLQPAPHDMAMPAPSPVAVPTPAPAPAPLPPPPAPAPLPTPPQDSGMPPYEPVPSEPAPHTPDLAEARQEVRDALAGQPAPQPIESLNALPLGQPLHQSPANDNPPPPVPPPMMPQV